MTEFSQVFLCPTHTQLLSIQYANSRVAELTKLSSSRRGAPQDTVPTVLSARPGVTRPSLGVGGEAFTSMTSAEAPLRQSSTASFHFWCKEQGRPILMSRQCRSCTIRAPVCTRCSYGESSVDETEAAIAFNPDIAEKCNESQTQGNTYLRVAKPANTHGDTRGKARLG